jgi:hypothetical protein
MAIMKIYTVVVNDRHLDTQVYPFSDKEKAISEARKIAKEYCRHERYYEEFEKGSYMLKDSWVFCIHYSTEDDQVFVEESTLDKEIEV